MNLRFAYRGRLLLAALISSCLSLLACSPALNWREVRPEGTRLSLLLPCKPDYAKKEVPLGGSPVLLSMAGCGAAGATFAVAFADLEDPAKVAPTLAQWQALTLANMKAAPPSASGAPDRTRIETLKLPKALPQPQPTRVFARGQRADGSPVLGQAGYFAQGTQVFQVVIYAKEIKPEAADTFFSSLKLD
ncbi:MAG: hypothetical protein V4731_04090 [Pseudomonadota bacterium]